MGEEKIQIVATAKDNASGTIKTLRSNVASLGTATKGPLGGMIGGLAGISGPALLAGAGIAAVTGFLKDGISSAIEEEKSLARLDTALKNNVTNWDGNRDAIDKAIESRMDLAFEDDALRDSMGKLVAATKDVNGALDLQVLAMDIARGRNIDLAAATDLVLKANMGNTGALRRAGIQIDQNATKTEILGKLQETYSGQAAAYAETTEGAMASANIAIGEAAETVGEALLPAIKELAGFIKDDLAPGIVAATDLLGEMGGGLNDVGKASDDAGKSLNEQIFGNANLDGTVIDEITDSIHRLWDSLDSSPAGTEGMTGMLKGFGRNAAAELRAAAPAVQRGVSFGYKDPLLAEMEEAKVAAIKFAKGTAWAITGDLAGALRGGVKSDIDAAMDAVQWAIEHPLALTRQKAKLEGAITTLEYKRGLASNSDEVNKIIDQQMAGLIAEWENIAGLAWGAGADAGGNFVTAYGRALAGLDVGARKRVQKSQRDTQGGKYGFRAGGGPVNEGTYVVGERGPELLRLGRGQTGNVTPNHALGGGPIVVNIDGRELFRIVDERMGKRLAMSSNNAYVRG